MKRVLITLSTIGFLAWITWINRLDVLVWGLPIITELRDPISANHPVTWPSPKTTDTTQQSSTNRPPNIILILADDMGFNDISLYNGGAADGSLMTPNIDAIANAGVTFNNGYAANAVCAPSRASIMTGRYSTRFGFEFTPFFKIGATIFQWIQDVDKPILPTYIDHKKAATLPDMHNLGMPADEVTIAETLHDAGYYTAHIGKWHLGATQGMRPEDQGFDDSLYMAGTLYLPEDDPDVVNAKIAGDGIDQMVWATGRYAVQFNGGEKFAPTGYLTDYFTHEAVKVIEANKDRPFFLYLAHWGIHNPLQARQEDFDDLAHIKAPTLRTYAAMIRALDRGVGEVIKALEDNGLSDNTLVVFTSDNGGANYIGLPNINKPYRGWKLTHFEGGTHVPFMAKWPAAIKADSQFDKPVQHMDLFSTFAAIASATVPEDRVIDGVNLLPYIQGVESVDPHETLFWREGQQQAVLRKDWKLITAGIPDKRWLFDLQHDPTEQRNVVTQYPEKVEMLEALLAQHNAEQAPPAWPSVINVPILIDKTGSQVYEDGDEYIYWPN